MEAYSKKSRDAVTDKRVLENSLEAKGSVSGMNKK
jgi:hypothetical protein